MSIRASKPVQKRLFNRRFGHMKAALLAPPSLRYALRKRINLHAGKKGLKRRPRGKVPSSFGGFRRIEQKSIDRPARGTGKHGVVGIVHGNGFVGLDWPDLDARCAKAFLEAWEPLAPAQIDEDAASQIAADPVRQPLGVSRSFRDMQETRCPGSIGGS